MRIIILFRFQPTKGIVPFAPFVSTKRQMPSDWKKILISVSRSSLGMKRSHRRKRIRNLCILTWVLVRVWNIETLIIIKIEFAHDQFDNQHVDWNKWRENYWNATVETNRLETIRDIDLGSTPGCQRVPCANLGRKVLPRWARQISG